MVGNWAVFPEYLLLGSLGAASIEWLKSYELKHRYNSQQFKRLLHSLIYWGKFFLFLFASGFVAWAITENNPNATVWQIVISGAGANALANKGVEASLSKENLYAGENRVEQPPNATYNVESDTQMRIKLRDLF